MFLGAHITELVFSIPPAILVSILESNRFNTSPAFPEPIAFKNLTYWLLVISFLPILYCLVTVPRLERVRSENVSVVLLYSCNPVADDMFDGLVISAKSKPSTPLT